MLQTKVRNISYTTILSSMQKTSTQVEGESFLPSTVYLSSFILSTNSRPMDYPRKEEDSITIQYEINPEVISIEDILQRLQLWKDLNHPNVLKCYHYEQLTTTSFFVTAELCPLLKQFLQTQEKDSFNQTLCLALADIVSGMTYLASQSIIHRNINLNNIFKDRLGRAKIGGFGLCMKADHFPIDGIAYKVFSSSMYFTLTPEGYLNHLYGHKTDIWALGALLYEFYHGHSFLTTTDQLKLINSFTVSEEKIDKRVPPEMRNFMMKCLTGDWQARPLLLALKFNLEMLFKQQASSSQNLHYQAALFLKFQLFLQNQKDYDSFKQCYINTGFFTKERIKWTLNYAWILHYFLTNFVSQVKDSFDWVKTLAHWLLKMLGSIKEKVLLKLCCYQGQVLLQEKKLLQNVEGYINKYTQQLNVKLDFSVPFDILNVIDIFFQIDKALQVNETSSKDRLKLGISLGLIIWATKLLQKCEDEKSAYPQYLSFDYHEKFLMLQTQFGKKKMKNNPFIEISWDKYREIKRQSEKQQKELLLKKIKTSFS